MVGKQEVMQVGKAGILTQEVRLLSRLDGILIEMVVEEREPA